MNEAEILRKIVLGNNNKLNSFVAKVTKVHDRTCDVDIVLTGAPLEGVKLNTAGQSIVIKPQEGSHVVVTKLSNADSFVSLYSEIEEVALDIKGNITLNVEGGINIDTSDDIIFNGGENGGLIIIEKLTEKLKELTEWCQNHKHDVSGITTTCSCGGTVSFSGEVAAPEDKTPEFNYEKYENPKIQH
ncbi:MAG: hypothetical protein LBQ22_01885 [Bacteroidales bacterium]|jgi:hypothetical protein|nr:hypothetical protein [Bacteroidales bacterium]